MFKGCTKLNTFKAKEINTTETGSSFMTNIGLSDAKESLTTFEADLPKLTDGNEMFYKCTALTSFKSDMPNLEIMTSMFDTCKKLSSFDSSPTLNAVTNADFAFYECYELPKFNCSEMNALTSAKSMFYRCESLEQVNTSFNSLETAFNMFGGCTNLKSIRNSFLAVKNGRQMFNGCTSLESFELNFPNLEDGKNMFYRCSSLTSITNVNLQNLYSAEGMFTTGVGLDKASCISLGNALAANVASWPTAVDGSGNGVTINVNAGLKDDEDVKEALGNLQFYNNELDCIGEIINASNSKIVIRVLFV